MQNIRKTALTAGLVMPGLAALAALSMGQDVSASEVRKALSVYTRDDFTTYDQATIDSAGAFLVGQLERLDPMIHAPLAAVTWTRDIDLRTDVQLSDDYTSYTTQTFASVGGTAPQGISWASKQGTAIPRITVDAQKVVNDLTPWAEEVSYTVKELAASQRLAQPIDAVKLVGLNLKHQMDIDQMVYVGDPTISAKGLVNHALVTNVSNVAASGTGSSTLWTTKTPDQITADFNEMMISAWAATGYSFPPANILVAPVPFGYLASTKVSNAGNTTILAYVKANNILTAEYNTPLDIKPCKWLDKNNINGPGGTAATYDRMIAYTRKQEYVRFPMVPLMGLAPQYRSVFIAVPYLGQLGRVEAVYPETLAYRDGIN